MPRPAGAGSSPVSLAPRGVPARAAVSVSRRRWLTKFCDARQRGNHIERACQQVAEDLSRRAPLGEWVERGPRRPLPATGPARLARSNVRLIFSTSDLRARLRPVVEELLE